MVRIDHRSVPTPAAAADRTGISYTQQDPALTSFFSFCFLFLFSFSFLFSFPPLPSPLLSFCLSAKTPSKEPFKQGLRRLG